MKKLTNILFFLIITTIIGCNPEKKDWKKALKADSVPIYEEFVENHPTSSFVDSAKYKIEELYYVEALSLKSNQSLINFIQRYPNSKVIDSLRLEKGQTVYLDFLSENPYKRNILKISKNKNLEFVLLLYIPPGERIYDNIIFATGGDSVNVDGYDTYTTSLSLSKVFVYNDDGVLQYTKSGEEGSEISMELKDDNKIIQLFSEIVIIDPELFVRIAKNKAILTLNKKVEFKIKNKKIEISTGEAYVLPYLIK
jgi:hypothetical protein